MTDAWHECPSTRRRVAMSSQPWPSYWVKVMTSRDSCHARTPDQYLYTKLNIRVVFSDFVRPFDEEEREKKENEESVSSRVKTWHVKAEIERPGLGQCSSCINNITITHQSCCCSNPIHKSRCQQPVILFSWHTILFTPFRNVTRCVRRSFHPVPVGVCCFVAHRLSVPSSCCWKALTLISIYSIHSLFADNCFFYPSHKSPESWDAIISFSSWGRKQQLPFGLIAFEAYLLFAPQTGRWSMTRRPQDQDHQIKFWLAVEL